MGLPVAAVVAGEPGVRGQDLDDDPVAALMEATGKSVVEVSAGTGEPLPETEITVGHNSLVDARRHLSADLPYPRTEAILRNP